jgi:nitrogen fixation protein FixH
MSSARPFELRGPHVLVGTLAFFAAVIAVNVAFAIVAVQTFPGEDARRSYLQGLNYNATLTERRAQTALGWRVQAALAREPSGAVVEVVLRDRSGAPLDGLSVSGALRRPLDARYDHDLAFRPAGDGRYVAPIGALTPGRWQLRAHAQDAGGGARDFAAELSW